MVGEWEAFGTDCTPTPVSRWIGDHALVVLLRARGVGPALGTASPVVSLVPLHGYSFELSGPRRQRLTLRVLPQSGRYTRTHAL